MADTWLDIVTDALLEIGAYAPGEPIPAADTEFCRRKLNKILDQQSARKIFAYNVNFASFTLTPNHQPHLIGPGLSSPDFAAAQRPVRIEAAALILNTSTPNVDVPLNIRDDDWWARQRVKALSTTVPTDLYYSPDFPNGSLYLWPVPTFAYGLRLETWVTVGQVDVLVTDFIAPPGYNQAITLTLAEDACGAFGKEPSPSLAQKAIRARAALQSNNDKSPRIASADHGSSGRRRGGFNYYTGGPA